MSSLIKYRLTDLQTARLTVRVGDVVIETDCIARQNTLQQMLAAAYKASKGGRHQFQSIHENGYFLWSFEKQDDRLMICVTGYSLEDGLGSDFYTVNFGVSCDYMEFVRALFSEMNLLLEEYKASGYQELWQEHEFPLRKYLLLRKLVDGPINWSLFQ